MSEDYQFLVRFPAYNEAHSRAWALHDLLSEVLEGEGTEHVSAADIEAACQAALDALEKSGLGKLHNALHQAVRLARETPLRPGKELRQARNMAGYGATDIRLAVEALANRAFGSWGAYFFFFAHPHLPPQVFDAKAYGPELEEPAKPVWVKDRAELYWGAMCIRSFRRLKQAQNCCLILDAFEEEGWPVSPLTIDDPLPHGQNAERLHDAIKSLNNGLKVIRFHVEKRERIRWERVIPDGLFRRAAP